MRLKFVFLAIAIGITFTHIRAQTASVDSSRLNCIDAARTLLDEALLIMQKNYYRKDSVQWEPLFREARTTLNESADCESAYKTVQWCFDQLKEEHSFIMTPAKAAVYSGSVNTSKPVHPARPRVGSIQYELIDNNIAYLNVPWISTTDKAICTGYADTLQSLIKRSDEIGVNRWIIDLRQNTGGNCWPMIAGLGPLLGEGILGYFISPKEKIPISYRNGISMQGHHARCAVSTPYFLRQNKKSIAVLIDRRTASAGEIVALTFKGMKDVYLFGEPTAGLTTANATYPLSDGSMLVLTVSKEADRHGNVVEGKIHPNELVRSSAAKGSDAVKDAALMFLQLQ